MNATDGAVAGVPHVAGRYLSEQEKKLAMHAGHAETALMLALAPDTVHMERAVTNYPPPFPSSLLSPDGRPACAWSARDFGPSGVIGDPLPATAEHKGYTAAKGKGQVKTLAGGVTVAFHARAGLLKPDEAKAMEPRIARILA